MNVITKSDIEEAARIGEPLGAVKFSDGATT